MTEPPVPNGDVSWWWRSLGGTPTPRAPLAGDLDVDVAIVGGGYTGLWTAYYLKRGQPDLRVVIGNQSKHRVIGVDHELVPSDGVEFGELR